MNDLWALDYIPGNFLGYNNEFDFESMIHLNWSLELEVGSFNIILSYDKYYIHGLLTVLGKLILLVITMSLILNLWYTTSV